MSNAIKKWTKPQLIVLTRVTAQESVLTHCKRIGQFQSEANLTAQDGCDKGVNDNCGACQARNLS